MEEWIKSGDRWAAITDEALEAARAEIERLGGDPSVKEQLEIARRRLEMLRSQAADCCGRAPPPPDVLMPPED